MVVSQIGDDNEIIFSDYSYIERSVLAFQANSTEREDAKRKASIVAPTFVGRESLLTKS